MTKIINNRIHKRRLRNIYSLRDLARLEFPRYLNDNGFSNLSDKQQERKFKGFFAEWIGKKYDYWRMMEKGRRAITDSFIIELEDKCNLVHGTLDQEDLSVVQSRAHLMKSIKFVTSFLKSNETYILNKKETSKLIDAVYSASLKDQNLTNEIVQNCLSSLDY